ncbi:MAG: hypothetical protein J0J04_04790 [Microbacterium sp.]|uniref:hypothetical protein n=1 Tax=Microbacterium sp. TaxID=51671 RepID=UPI001AC759AF|nr:hypothetical protein [Microbacterium sp.]MBN9214125.1 hypothetical protein [Microbacterium sp.]
MTLVTRDQAAPAKAKVRLTRSTRDTVVWVARTALTTKRPEQRAPRPGSPKGKITLTRTPRETFQWMMRATPWGAASIIGAVVAVVSVLVGLWMLVPVIDATVAGLTDTASGALGWLLDQLAAFPTWLGSLFPSGGETGS